MLYSTQHVICYIQYNTWRFFYSSKLCTSYHSTTVYTAVLLQQQYRQYCCTVYWCIYLVLWIDRCAAGEAHQFNDNEESIANHTSAGTTAGTHHSTTATLEHIHACASPVYVVGMRRFALRIGLPHKSLNTCAKTQYTRKMYTFSSVPKY